MSNQQPKRNHWLELEKWRRAARKAKLDRSDIEKRKNSKYNYRRKIKCINAYGGKCVCCGESHWQFLSIDHINGGGREHRRQLGGHAYFYEWLKRHGYPKDNYRCLCYNCNQCFGIYGYCPHNTLPAIPDFKRNERRKFKENQKGDKERPLFGNLSWDDDDNGQLKNE